jgi:hypothetical protein
MNKKKTLVLISVISLVLILGVVFVVGANGGYSLNLGSASITERFWTMGYSGELLINGAGLFKLTYNLLSFQDRADIILRGEKGDLSLITAKTGEGTYPKKHNIVFKPNEETAGYFSREGDFYLENLVHLQKTDNPGTCNEDNEGAVYYDTDANEPCYCNSTNWLKFSDSSTC